MRKYVYWIVSILLIVLVYSTIQAYKLTGIVYIISQGKITAAMLRGQRYTVVFDYPEYIYPLYGKAYGRVAEVSMGLPAHMQKFVLLHEVFHLQDTNHKSRIVREIHASLAAGIYEPIGIVQTLFKSLTDPGRLKYYWKTYGLG